MVNESLRMTNYL